MVMVLETMGLLASCAVKTLSNGGLGGVISTPWRVAPAKRRHLAEVATLLHLVLRMLRRRGYGGVVGVLTFLLFLGGRGRLGLRSVREGVGRFLPIGRTRRLAKARMPQIEQTANGLERAGSIFRWRR